MFLECRKCYLMLIAQYLNILDDYAHENVTVCRSRIWKLDIIVSTECYFCVGFLVVSVGVTFFGGYLIFKCCVSTRCAFWHSGFSCCLMSKCFSAYMQNSQYMYHSNWFEFNLVWQSRGSWNWVEHHGFLLSSKLPSWAINWVWISTSCLLHCEKR